MIENYSINSVTLEVTGTFEGQPFVLAPKIVDEKLVAIEELECAEILAYRKQAEAFIKENSYKALRASEYPSFADQFDLLYHGGYEAWKASIDTIKAKYPKE